jgi:hypothetical protein
MPGARARTSGFVKGHGSVTQGEYTAHPSATTTRHGPRDDISGMSGSQYGNLPPVASMPATTRPAQEEEEDQVLHLINKV